MRVEIGNSALELVQGDITEEKVDAVGNAANAALAGGGGVDGAIHRRGGSKIMEECTRFGGCPTGQTVMTTGGDLPAKKVLHTVGPIWRGGNQGEPELLASCYRTMLELADKEGLRTVAFPSISTGVYGYPVDRAAKVAISAIKEFLETHEVPELVRMVLFDANTLAAYEKALNEIM